MLNLIDNQGREKEGVKKSSEGFPLQKDVKMFTLQDSIYELQSGLTGLDGG